MLLVDPYFTRVQPKDGEELLSPDAAAIAAHAPSRADVVLVSHSHWDHLLDVPSIVKATDAKLVGTDSTLAVARASNVPEAQLIAARGGETFTFDPFVVHVVLGLHSLTGQPFATIPEHVKVPMKADAWAEGGTLQYLVQVDGRSVLFISTANFIEHEIDGLRPDVAIVAVGLRGKVPDYSCRLMRALGRPKVVVANHFDAHWEPLGPKQMEIGEEARASLARFVDEVHACAPATNVVVPRHFESIEI